MLNAFLAIGGLAIYKTLLLKIKKVFKKMTDFLRSLNTLDTTILQIIGVFNPQLLPFYHFSPRY